MKLYKSNTDKELFYYFNAKGEKRWMFRHRYYDTLGKRREKSRQGFTKEKEAYKALLEVKTKILNGSVKQVQNDKITISEWLDIWYESNKHEWKVSTRNQRKNAIKNHMKPLIGHYKLTELDKSTYKREFINALLNKKGFEPTTVTLYHSLFKVAINSAVEDEIIPRNRFRKIIIEDNRTLDNFLLPKDLIKLLNVAKDEENITNYTSLLLLSYTGLRRGEMMGLKWKDIDFKKGTLTVERTRDSFGTRSPKTKRSYRTILVDAIVIKQLKNYLKWCKIISLAFGKRISKESYVFISYQTGCPVSDNTLQESLSRSLKKAKVKKITIHGLRHTHATILISKRIPVRTIADRLGNTPQMIYDVYGHSFKELEKESVDAFNDSLKNNRDDFGGDSGGES